MRVRVGINGFGRIGRTVFRILCERKEEFEVVLINDPTRIDVLLPLLKHDTVYRSFPERVSKAEGGIQVGDKFIRVSSEKEPDKIAWRKVEVDVVLESSGKFRTRDETEKHLSGGAPKVLLSAPVKGSQPIDLTVVVGVNDNALTPQMRLVSNASCTTNCVVPIAKVLHDEFGIVEGLMTTVHAYTSSQDLVDGANKDPRRARAAAQNIVPTTTGAADLVGQIIPDLAGKLTGVALRVPVPCGSITDLTVRLKKNATASAVNTAFQKASEGMLKNILLYTEEPLVSSDIIGSPFSCVFDASWTRVVGDNFIKVFGWYDNEFGYSSRTVDILKRMATR